MAGKKGMRHYSEEQIESIKEMERKGMTHREIGKEAGLEMKQVRKLLERQRTRDSPGSCPQTKREAAKNTNDVTATDTGTGTGSGSMKGFSARCWKEVRKSVKYAAIESTREKYGVSYLCAYFGVSRSGYYAWRKRKDQPNRDEILGKLIQECQEHTNYTYGYRRGRALLLPHSA